MKSKSCGGFETINTSRFKVPMPTCITEDINHLYVIRFSAQKSRLVGYRRGNVFHVIFVDIDLSTYDH